MTHQAKLALKSLVVIIAGIVILAAVAIPVASTVRSRLAPYFVPSRTSDVIEKVMAADHLAKSGRQQEAYDSYSKVLASHPLLTNALLGRALVGYSLGKHSQTIKDIDLAESIMPNLITSELRQIRSDCAAQLNESDTTP